MAALDDITPLIEEKLGQLGLELYDIKFLRAGPKSILRVFIDKESGVTIDDCEEASNEISPLLDVENFSNTPYRLEVSSPGADRPLRSEKDFRRARGRSVMVQHKTAEGKQTTVTGLVSDCVDGRVRLQTSEDTAEIALENIVSAKIELSFK